jgi:hypothetical protein
MASEDSEMHEKWKTNGIFTRITEAMESLIQDLQRPKDVESIHAWIESEENPHYRNCTDRGFHGCEMRILAWNEV